MGSWLQFKRVVSPSIVYKDRGLDDPFFCNLYNIMFSNDGCMCSKCMSNISGVHNLVYTDLYCYIPNVAPTSTLICRV